MHSDHTFSPDGAESTTANLGLLWTAVLQMMNETQESLDSTTVDWTDEILNFIEATSSPISADELSDVSRSRFQL